MPFDKKVEVLIKKYWPGALTIILNSQTEMIPEIVRGGGKTVGVRIPDHDLAKALIRGADIPIIGSSANFSGDKTPFSLKGLDKTLIKLVDFVLEGKTRGIYRTSTVIDCSKKPWKIIRQGEVVPDL
jgi:L-threonylcarbamoyladenylate synthase